MSGAAPAARALGFWSCLALVVGNMIGSGVFLLPASLAPLGWNAVFGWVLTIAGGLCIAYVFAVLARLLPQAGGPYAYTRAAFGPAPGFLVAWSYWISLWVGNAGIAIGGVSYLTLFAPSIRDVPGLAAAITCAVIWTLTIVNIWGVRTAGQVQIVTTLLKLLPLAAVVVLAALILGRDGGLAMAPFDPDTITPAAVTSAAALTLWGLLGLESATVPAEQVDRPERTIARATMLGTVITGVIYLVVCSAVTLLAPAAETAQSNAPIADFVAREWGQGAGALVALFAAISAFGALNGWILLQGEMPYAMARGGVFPAWMGTTTRRGTPARAHVASSVLLTVVTMSNYARSVVDLFTFLALLATTASLVAYLVCSLAALKLLRDGRLARSAPLVVIAIVAMLYALWTIYGAGFEAFVWGLALLATGVPVYWIMRSGAAEQPAQQ